MTAEESRLTDTYRQTFPGVLRMVRGWGGDLELAKDLFHDALIIFLEKQRMGNLELHGPAGAYLIGIVKVLWIKHRKAGAAVLALDPDEARLTVPEDFYTQPPREDVSLLDFLKSAGEKCMQLLKAFYYERRSMREIQEAFGYKSGHSATVQKYKCMEKVRQHVKSTRHAEYIA